MAKKIENKKPKYNLTIVLPKDYHFYLRRLSHEVSLKENVRIGCGELVRRALEAKYPIPGAQMSFDFDGGEDEAK